MLDLLGTANKGISIETQQLGRAEKKGKREDGEVWCLRKETEDVKPRKKKVLHRKLGSCLSCLFPSVALLETSTLKRLDIETSTTTAIAAAAAAAAEHAMNCS